LHREEVFEFLPFESWDEGKKLPRPNPPTFCFRLSELLRDKKTKPLLVGKNKTMGMLTFQDSAYAMYFLQEISR